jgi:hypothetical protein
MLSDKLFLAWNCSDCTKLKIYISDAMFDDTIRGKNGQILTVIHMFSNDGVRNVLDIFNVTDNHAPVLLTHEERIIDAPKDIISYLQDNGLATKQK